MKQIVCEVCGNNIYYEEAPVEETAAPEAQETQDTQETRDILTEILLNTREQCVMIDGMIRNQIDLKDAQIDKLHSELQYFKDDQASKFITRS